MVPALPARLTVAPDGTVALAHAIGMPAMAFTASSCARMARAFPMAGSVHAHAGRGIARPVGFPAGRMVPLDYVPVPGLLHLSAGIATLPAVPVRLWSAIVLNIAVNQPGIGMTDRINKFMLLAELVVLAVFLVFFPVVAAQIAARMWCC